MDVDPSRLKHLAEQRASKIKAHLIENDRISPERIDILESEIIEQWRENEARAHLSLSGQ
jgi:hypothetical protein